MPEIVSQVGLVTDRIGDSVKIFVYPLGVAFECWARGGSKMFGYIVLYTWPLVVFAFFRVWSPAVALLAAIIGGYLFLPTGLSLDLPGLPALNKDTIPATAAFIAAMITSGTTTPTSLPGWLPKKRLPILLIVILILGTCLTVLANRHPLFYGPLVFPALRVWDILSTLLSAVMMLLPFILGRKYLAHPEKQWLFLKALVIAGTGYSLLALYEIRMSPQLNFMIYGYFPHAWEQHIRPGGYRPLVFVQHGLWLAMFFAMCVLAAGGLAKYVKEKRGRVYLLLCVWLLMTLFLSNSLGAFLIAAILIVVMFVLNVRLHFAIAAVFSGIALLYPMLRGADLVPVNTIIEWVTTLSVDRADSLEFRVVNENYLLEKARERPLFGWGGWGRSFVYDPATGEGISLIADGYWVGVIGVGGWARYLSEFGLLCLPALVLFFRARRLGLGPETAILSLVLVANVIDLLPNATVTPITWLITGALWGRLELGRVATSDTEMAPVAEPKHALARARPRAPLPPSSPVPGPSAMKSRPTSRYTRQTNRIIRNGRGRKGTDA